MKDFINFKAEVKSALVKKGWTYAELSEATKAAGANGGRGYSIKTIEKLMCGSYVASEDNIATAIAKVLDIPQSLTV